VRVSPWRVGPGVSSRSPLLALALTALLASGCGNESVTGSATNPAEGIYGYVRDLIAGAGVGDPDLAAIVSASCETYAEGVQRPDSFTFDKYVGDLFNTHEGGLDQTRVDRAVADACNSFEGDVRRFVEDLSNSLDIDLDELRNYVAIACEGFEQRGRANADDPYAPEVFDPVVSDVLASGGLDRSDLSALVDRACQAVPPPDTDVPPPDTQPGPERRPAATTTVAP
jgi:hypothetical protein